ncbi:FecR family protein [Fodinibius roseus]|uniref:FecR family protein n=1 Tax=Fodinibius roseus TaxID=1194090 RepID=A0A1M5FXQ3_9BACT|nr:FecR domain-containing protein [Fodinibius roseus]SHF96340.1 FecR family protein [Fodinibius roseus]
MSKQNDQITQLLTDDSFLRWINDEATPLEQQKWDRWLEEDPANIQLLREARELYRSLQFEEEQPDTTAQLRRLEEALDAEKKYRQRIPLTGKRSPKNYWMRAAAVIVLLVAVLAVIEYAGWGPEQQPVKEEVATTFETVQTDYGETRILTFSDGSEITLNAHSQLTYPTTARPGDDMEVELEGEAYFSIDRKSGDRQRTFSVKTPEGRIAVLGTKFNVNTYSQDTEIVLEEGKVRVEAGETSEGSDQAYTMSPNELVRLQPENLGLEVEKVDTELYTSWTGFELKFRNTPLIQIAGRIKQLYGVNVEFKNENLKKVRFSGSAPNKNFAVLLEGLRTLLDIPIAYDEDTITFGG